MKTVIAHGVEEQGRVDVLCNAFCHGDLHTDVIWVPPEENAASIKREWPRRMRETQRIVDVVAAPEAKPLPYEEAVLQYQGVAIDMDEAHRWQIEGYVPWRVTWRRVE